MSCGSEGPRRDRAPVILIVFDALHAAHVSHLGHDRPTTPSLDALASEGVTFTQAFAPAPYTLASIPSLFTGRLPDHHGLVASGLVLPDDEHTLAELLGAAGYRTFAAVANIKGGSLYGLDQGFEQFLEFYDTEPTTPAKSARKGGALGRLPRAEAFLPVFREWLLELDAGEPAFLYAHVLEPHMPYDPPAKYRNLWLDPDYRGRFRRGATHKLMLDLQGRVVTPGQAAKQQAGDGYFVIERADSRAVKALYDANIRYADDVLGKLLELLRKSGLYDDAFIIVTSDHGEALWEHGRWGHSWHLYDEMLHVPLVVKFPLGSGPSDTRVDGIVSTMDLVPTLCELLNLAPPPGLDGRSLAATLERRPSAVDRRIYLRTVHSTPHIGLRTHRDKVIVGRDPETGATRRVQHFRVSDDPGEHNDLYSVDPAATLPHVAELEAWIRAADGNQARRSAEYTDSQRDLLRQLGYTD